MVEYVFISDLDMCFYHVLFNFDRLKQRQATANERLFPKVPETLALLRSTYPSAKIIAITNGRGTPDEMGRISEYFDLCVSGK